MTLKPFTCGIVASLFSLALSAQAFSQEKEVSTEPPLKIEQSQLATITASVMASDVASREVTLKGPQGNLAIVTVDNHVKRLNEVKVGDNVTAHY